MAMVPVAAVGSVDPDLQVREHQAEPEVTPDVVASVVVAPVFVMTPDLAVRASPVPDVVSVLARAVDAVPMLGAVLVTG